MKCPKCKKDFDGNENYTSGLSEYDPSGTYHCPHCDYIFMDDDITVD